MAQQTAVDLIISQLKKQKEILKNHFEAGKWNDDRVSEIDNCISICENTKQMEKNQIMKSFKSARIPYKYDADLKLNGFEDAEQYYNETFGKK